MNWILENWVTISTVLGLILTIATVVTHLTVTPVDDAVVDFLKRLLGALKPAGSAQAPLEAPKAEDKEEPLMKERPRL